MPARAPLDRAAPDHPVALVRIDDRHATWVNSAALAASGITRETRDPTGGLVVRDARGEAHRPPGGYHAAFVKAAEPDRTTRDSTRPFALPSANVWPRGSPASTRWARISALSAASRWSSVGTSRSVTTRRWPGATRPPQDLYRARGPEIMGDGRVVVGALKLLADGALGSRGAALHHPYCDDPENRGLVLIPPDEALSPHRGRDGAGLPGLRPRHRRPRQHPRARHLRARMLRDAPPARALRLRVEHAQILAEGDIGRFARLGVMPGMQATHCTSDMPWAVDDWGRTVWPAPTPAARSSPPACASRAAPTFRSRTRIPSTASSPRRRRPRHAERSAPGSRAAHDARGGGALLHQLERGGRAPGRETGTLEAGKRADLVALDEGVFTCPEARIQDIAPVLTMVGGELVHRRGI